MTFAGNLKKLLIFKVDQNQLVCLTPTIGKLVWIEYVTVYSLASFTWHGLKLNITEAVGPCIYRCFLLRVEHSTAEYENPFCIFHQQWKIKNGLMSME